MMEHGIGGRINGGMRAWMPLPEPYREQVGEK